MERDQKGSLSDMKDRQTARVARFLLVEHTKTGKLSQITIKYAKWSQNIYEIAVK
jgi:hypothetical protein